MVKFLDCLLRCMSPELCRVSDAGHRQPSNVHRRPASESRQGTNPRWIVRRGCRALGYGELSDAESESVDAQSRWRRLMTRLADSRRWACWSRLSLRVAVAGWVR